MAKIDEGKLPPYGELPGKPDLPRETSWGIFGDDYQLGTLNFLTPERVKAAARLVKTGKRFNLNLPLNQPHHPEGSMRGPYKHEPIVIQGGIGAGQLDEVLHAFNPQASTQWDGLGHVRHPRYGFYNGVNPDDVVPGDRSKLSIGKWTDAGGIVGRGLLLDVERYCAANGVAYNPRSRFVITREIVQAIAAWEKVEIGAGDVLLVRTGLMKKELGGAAAGNSPESPGLGPGREMAEFLWGKRVAAVAADTGPFEPSPIDPRGPRSMHMALIPMLGMPIGELWYLEELAEDCAKDRVYEFMLVSVPLNLPGGVGSPPNAVAIK